MSVLHCARGNCEQIMCCRYSCAYGYICNSCFDELCAKSIHADIKVFMSSDPALDTGFDPADYFGEIFRSTDHDG